MNKWFFLFLPFFVSLCFSTSYAYEPTNLTVTKQALIRYHDSGEYEKDINSVVQQATRYLQMRLSTKIPENKKPAIVLDIDETALSGFPHMMALDFGGTLELIRDAERKGVNPALAPTLQLYRYAKAHQVAIFFISGRLEDERKSTIQNLQQVGYQSWAGLFLRSKQYENVPATAFKTAMRKQITQQGYTILVNLGDQKSDLEGGFADMSFKVPNPYYHIP